MLYEDYLVMTIFTSYEIERLRDAYNQGISLYLDDAKDDPYPHDYTDEYIGDVVKDIFKGRGVDIQEQDVTYLTNTIRYYLL